MRRRSAARTSTEARDIADPILSGPGSEPRLGAAAAQIRSPVGRATGGKDNQQQPLGCDDGQYGMPPWGGPEQVLKYLARYTHRVAISNHRLVALEGDEVEFLWKDYAHGGGAKD